MWKTAYHCVTAQENELSNWDINTQERQGTQTYGKRPANASKLPVDPENVDNVEEQNHNQVAHGDNLKVAVCTVICPWRTIYTDESNQQWDLKEKRHIKDFYNDAQRAVEIILNTTKWHLETEDKYLVKTGWPQQNGGQSIEHSNNVSKFAVKWAKTTIKSEERANC